MIEVIGCTAVVSVGVLELAKVIESRDLFWVELNRRLQSDGKHNRTTATYIVMLLEVLQVLHFVLPHRLSNVRIFNHVQNRLSLLL